MNKKVNQNCRWCKIEITGENFKEHYFDCVVKHIKGDEE